MIVRATYANGVFVPCEPVAGLAPHQQVELRVSEVTTPRREPGLMAGEPGISPPFDLPRSGRVGVAEFRPAARRRPGEVLPSDWGSR
jgi:hypothetical protein